MTTTLQETALALPTRPPCCWPSGWHALASFAILCLLVDELLRFIPAHAVA